MSRAEDRTLSPLLSRPDVRLHRRDADYSQPLLTIPAEGARVMKEKLRVLYGERATGGGIDCTLGPYEAL